MNIKAIIKKNQGVVFCYLIALVLFAGFSVYMPGFARLSHIRTVFLESALIGIVALGQTLVHRSFCSMDDDHWRIHGVKPCKFQ